MKKSFLILLILVFAARFVLAQSAPDPIRIATGARPLGMGKAFVGLADDVGSVFLNPAGLANVERWQVTSMQGTLIEEFNYLSLSGLYPTNFGNFGLAYVGSSIGGALPTTIEAGSDPDDPIYTVDEVELARGGAMSYYNNLLLLSYGNKLEPILNLPGLSLIGDRFPGLKGVNLGLNLKLFFVNLTGDGITQGSASGRELDLGVQGKPYSWLALGANLQNLLPSSLGGKLRYDANNWEESYPAVLKLGAAIDLIGPKDSLRALGNHEIKVLADLDYEVSRSSQIPTIFHFGMEWKPMDVIAVRAGIDQEMIGIGQVANNMTGGVGVYYGDFRFDYAYHQFAGAPGVDNHFVSLSYGITPVKIIEEEDRLVTSPDKLITTAGVVAVEGVAADKQIVSIKVNGIKVSLTPRGAFKTNVSLKIGKNAILVEGFDSKEKLLDADKLRVVRLITYPDVNKNYWASQQISYIGSLGIIKGYPDGNFKPAGSITRAELSTMLMRTKMGGDNNVPKTQSKLFKDLPLKHWATKYVNLAAKSGVVKGYPDGSFRPSGKVTRAEGLAMIARFGEVKQVPFTKEFIDVKAKYWAAPIIAGAYKEGMLIFLKAKPFEPSRQLTRAEAVEMLYRSKPVAGLITDLLDFEKGY
ncbi:MAG: S-layer homology domain-containing protein [Candidatus Margulisiibacteriota bacterium]